MGRLLVVVDFQDDFVDGALGFPGAEALDERIAAKIREYRASGDLVAFTLDTHAVGYLQTQEGKNLPVEHCIKGTDGWRLYGKVAAEFRQGDPVFEKPTFGSDALFDFLRDAQKRAPEGEPAFASIELVGLVSNICVLSNAVVAKTACPEVPVMVDASCTASFDAKLNEEALDVLEGIQVKVVNR